MSAAAPLDTGERTVPADWIDYNGHMNDGYYALAFTEATEAFPDKLGLGAACREQAGCGIYTVESHLCFFRSVLASAPSSCVRNRSRAPARTLRKKQRWLSTV